MEIRHPRERSSSCPVNTWSRSRPNHTGLNGTPVGDLRKCGLRRTKLPG